MVRVFSGLREEVRLTNLSLDHPHPARFVSAQFQSRVLYGCWRVFWALFHLTWVLLSWVLEPWGSYRLEERVKWFIYLTNWTYLLLALETSLEAVNFVYVHALRKDIVQGTHKVAMPWYLKLQWTMYNVVTTGSLMVTAWYWTILYKGDKEVGAVSVAFHGLNSFYVLANLLLTTSPTRLLHALHPMLWGVAYTAFTALYQLSGGTSLKGDPYIYTVTDWARPAKTLLTSSLSNFLAVPVMHLAVFLFRWGVERGWRYWRGTVGRRRRRMGGGGGGGGGGFVGRNGGGGVACIDLGETTADSSSVQGEPLVDEA
ncbi:hypothetical protein ACOMHN_038278 [Nucella lapillus]